MYLGSFADSWPAWKTPNRVQTDPAISAAPEPTLSASEIGSYAFCPRAWYLQRLGVPTDRGSEARRRLGSRAHRRIGRRTTLLLIADTARRLLRLPGIETDARAITRDASLTRAFTNTARWR